MTEINNENVETVEAPVADEPSAKKKPKKSDAEIEKLKSELEAKENELAELNDKYMRMAAEYDNFRKRSLKERDGVYAEAYGDAMAQVLPIIDNM